MDRLGFPDGPGRNEARNREYAGRELGGAPETAVLLIIGPDKGLIGFIERVFEPALRPWPAFQLQPGRQGIERDLSCFAGFRHELFLLFSLQVPDNIIGAFQETVFICFPDRGGLLKDVHEARSAVMTGFGEIGTGKERFFIRVIKIVRGQPPAPVRAWQKFMYKMIAIGRSSRSTLIEMKFLLRRPATSRSSKDSLSIT